MRPEPTAGTVDPPIAAIDIGSNSIKMTVARPHPHRGIEEIGWNAETVRLGAGLDATGRLADDRVEAALATLHRFAREARAMGAKRLVAVATEAARVAANGPAFLDRVGRETGIEVRVIDGDEEAALTFRGLAAATDVSGNLVVVDIGGASTELIVAHDRVFAAARSVPVGSGRLTDRLTPSDPPRPEELAACRSAAASLVAPVLAALAVPVGPAVRLVVVGGTGEYLARLVPDEHRIAPAAIDAVLDRFAAVTAAALAQRLSVAESRARVLPAGVAIVAALVDGVRPGRIEVARSGIRTGLLLAAFEADHAARDREPAHPHGDR
jgi:exopolyphosphatase/guanosine-5'-triphosphate,3'-diphosphate pyrophosphatase